MTDLAKLRSLAEAATPGPWHDWEGAHEVEIANIPPFASDEAYYDDDRNRDEYVVIKSGCGNCGGFNAPSDAAYVAALDPQTVLALIDRAEASERLAAAVLSLLEARHADAHRGAIFDGGTWEDHNCALCADLRADAEAFAKPEAVR